MSKRHAPVTSRPYRSPGVPRRWTARGCSGLARRSILMKTSSCAGHSPTGIVRSNPHSPKDSHFRVVQQLLEGHSCCHGGLPIMLEMNAYSNLPGSRNGKCVWIGAWFTADNNSSCDVYFKLGLTRDGVWEAVWQQLLNAVATVCLQDFMAVAIQIEVAIDDLRKVNFYWLVFDITIIAWARFINQQELVRLFVWRVDLKYNLCPLLVCRLMASG